jgi:hypothetical protein
MIDTRTPEQHRERVQRWRERNPEKYRLQVERGNRLQKERREAARQAGFAAAAAHVNVVDLAWVAGMFDGEGSVNVACRPNPQTRRGAWTTRVRISNTYEPAIIAIAAILGFGRIDKHARRTSTDRQVYDWSAEALQAEKFMRLVRPLLRIKHEQVDIALAAMELRRTAQRAVRGPSNGKGAPTIGDDVHDQLAILAQRVRDLNGHHPTTIP